MLENKILDTILTLIHDAEEMAAKHGRSGYVHGCRCAKCVAGNRAYQLKYLRQRMAAGVTDGHGKVIRKLRGGKPQE